MYYKLQQGNLATKLWGFIWSLENELVIEREIVASKSQIDERG
jgi:hypothetical protein